MWKIDRSTGEFKAIIGEEGAVFAYFFDGVLKHKLFVRSTSEADTAELATLLQQDPEAPVEIYLDVLDQNYLQRVLPGVDRFSIGRLAKQRLLKETPPSHLKVALQVGRLSTGRHDWVYTFISAAYEPPVSTWIEFLMGFGNIIVGLYLLPIEAFNVIAALRENAVDSMQLGNSGSNNSALAKITKRIWAGVANLRFYIAGSSLGGAKQRWDVLLLSNKSGGIRQAVYHNDRVVFTRLLNNIADPNPDVVAGNIEQELNNSIEYLRRFSLRTDDEIIVYMVVAGDVKQNIRKEKILANSVFMMTPYEGSILLDSESGVAKEQDRFAEPLVLSILSQHTRRLARLYTAAMRQAYFIYHGIRYGIKAITLVIPLLIFLGALSLNSAYKLTAQIADNEKKRLILTAEIERNQAIKVSEEGKFGSAANIGEIQEILAIYKHFERYSINPINVIASIAAIDPVNTRIRNFDLKYTAPYLTYSKLNTGVVLLPSDKPAAPANAPGVVQIAANEKQEIKTYIKAAILFSNKNGQYEELVAKYNMFAENLTKQMVGYEIRLAPLPSNFSLDQIPEEIVVDLELTKVTIDSSKG